jgi:signal transduction histidine kinase
VVSRASPVDAARVSAISLKRFLSLLRIPPLVALVLAAGIILSLGIAAYAENGYRRLEGANRQLAVALELQTSLLATQALVVSAEAGQRGYMLTGRREYLEPYNTAVPQINAAMTELSELLVANGTVGQREIASRFNNLVGKKLAELEAAVSLYDKQGAGAAQALMDTGIGKRTMDEIRKEVADLTQTHRQTIDGARARWNADIFFARIGMLLMTAFTIALAVVVWVLVRRDEATHAARRAALAEDRARLEAEIEERTAELVELSNHLQLVREEEKSKLARDIHDELGGILVAAKMDVTWAQSRIKGANAEASGRLERALKALDDGVQIKRRIIEELRPTLLDNLGLSAALEWQVHEVCDRAGIACEIGTPDDDSTIPPPVSIALYRILQESLTNVVKYAHAKQVTVDLAVTDDSVMLLVEDNGVGIPEQAQHNRLSHGITGMRQRVTALGGEFAVRRRPEGGTTIEVNIPLVPPVRGAAVVQARLPQPA